MCGQRHRVERRIERIIVDGTGEMRQIRNTVYLEGSPCACAYVAFGGCPTRRIRLLARDLASPAWKDPQHRRRGFSPRALMIALSRC